MAVNAILAIIAGGGRAIVVIYREGVEINYFLLYFIDSAKTLLWQPLTTPCEGDPGGCGMFFQKTMPLEGRTAPSWWRCLRSCVQLAKSLPSRSFLFPPEWT